MTVSKANEDVEFGLRFHVRDCGRDVFLQFVESITDTFALVSESWPDHDPRWSCPETGRVMDTDNLNQKVDYKDESDYKDYHRLRVFGAFARYDWSALDFTLPLSTRICASDIPHLDASFYHRQLIEDDEESGSGEAVDNDDDNSLNDGNEVISLDSDDEVVSTKDEDE